MGNRIMAEPMFAALNATIGESMRLRYVSFRLQARHTASIDELPQPTRSLFASGAE